MSEDRAPEEIEERFLAELRERVAWQADAADRARRGLPPTEPEPPRDPEPSNSLLQGDGPARRLDPGLALELRALERHAEAEPPGERRDELLVYVRALRPFADADGRLPDTFGELVRSVFA